MWKEKKKDSELQELECGYVSVLQPQHSINE